MALNETECKISETMARIPDHGFDIGYANVYRWLIDKEGNITPDILRYGSEEKRLENPDNHAPLICVGFPVPEALKKEINDFLGTKLYPYLEAYINFQALTNERVTELNSIVAKDEADKLIKTNEINNRYDTEIDGICATLGISL